MHSPPLPGTPCDAALEMFREGDSVRIHGVFRSDGCNQPELEYRMEVLKESRHGTSSTRQGGAFNARQHETRTLSTVRLGVQPGDRLVGFLTVSGREQVVAGDTLAIVIDGSF